MYNHAPADYKCPICLGTKGIENEDTYICKSDIVYQDDLVTAIINSFFIKNNPGHVIIVPNEHFENIYDLPQKYGARIFEVARKIALAMKKAYRCQGITTLQNNEPAGNQHAFHFHFHVFPRYEDDDLLKNMGDKKLASPQERKKYAEKIKEYLEEPN